MLIVFVADRSGHDQRRAFDAAIVANSAGAALKLRERRREDRRQADRLAVIRRPRELDLTDPVALLVLVNNRVIYALEVAGHVFERVACGFLMLNVAVKLHNF